MPELIVPEFDFENPGSEGNWVLTEKEGIAIARVEELENQEVTGDEWCLEIETALPGWSGIGGIRSTTITGYPNEDNEFELIFKMGTHRTLFPAISERTGADSQITFHEMTPVEGTGFWEKISFSASFGASGELARIFLRIDGPTEPDEPIFYVDAVPVVWPPALPEIRVQDNFETGDYSKWTELQVIGGTAKAELITDKPISGNYSFKATVGPLDERTELAKYSSKAHILEGEELWCKFHSILQGDVLGLGTLCQFHNSSDVGSGPLELGLHSDTERIVIGGGPTGGVEFGMDWIGPKAVDVMGKVREYIFHFYTSTDPEKGWVEIWVNRKKQRLTDDWYKDLNAGKNTGGFKKVRATHPTNEPEEYLYFKIGNYTFKAAEGIGSHTVDNIIVTTNKELIFTEQPEYIYLENEWVKAPEFIYVEGNWKEVI